MSSRRNPSLRARAFYRAPMLFDQASTEIRFDAETARSADHARRRSGSGGFWPRCRTRCWCATATTAVVAERVRSILRRNLKRPMSIEKTSRDAGDLATDLAPRLLEEEQCGFPGDQGSCQARHCDTHAEKSLACRSRRSRVAGLLGTQALFTCVSAMDGPDAGRLPRTTGRRCRRAVRIPPTRLACLVIHARAIDRILTANRPPTGPSAGKTCRLGQWANVTLTKSQRASPSRTTP